MFSASFVIPVLRDLEFLFEAQKIQLEKVLDLNGGLTPGCLPHWIHHLFFTIAPSFESTFPT